MGLRSKLSVEIKLLLYKAILKPVWTYGIQLWGSAAKSNVEILQRFQSKVLRIITNAHWFMTNEDIHRDADILSVREEVYKHSTAYRERLPSHPNALAPNLMRGARRVRRLKRKLPCDLIIKWTTSRIPFWHEKWFGVWADRRLKWWSQCTHTPHVVTSAKKTY